MTMTLVESFRALADVNCQVPYNDNNDMRYAEQMEVVL